MNNQKFTQWITKTKHIHASRTIHESIDLLHHRKKTHLVWLSTATLSLLCLLLVVTINLSTPFYLSARQSVFGPFIEVLRFVDSPYQKLIDLDQYQPLDITIKIDHEEVSVDYLIVDGYTINLITLQPTTLLHQLSLKLNDQDLSFSSYGVKEDYGVISAIFDSKPTDQSQIDIYYESKVVGSVIIDGQKISPSSVADLHQEITIDNETINLKSLELTSTMSILTIQLPSSQKTIIDHQFELIDQNGHNYTSSYSFYTNDQRDEMSIIFPIGKLDESLPQQLDIKEITLGNNTPSLFYYDMSTDTFSDLPLNMSVTSMACLENQCQLSYMLIGLDNNIAQNPVDVLGDTVSSTYTDSEQYFVNFTKQEEQNKITFTTSLPYTIYKLDEHVPVDFKIKQP